MATCKTSTLELRVRISFTALWSHSFKWCRIPPWYGGGIGSKPIVTSYNGLVVQWIGPLTSNQSIAVRVCSGLQNIMGKAKFLYSIIIKMPSWWNWQTR